MTKTYLHGGRRLEILRGIDLTLEPGEMMAVAGASGAGKSTLLHILGTIDLPTSGQVLINDTDIATLGAAPLARFRNRTIGFVFQFHHLLPEFTALENVMMPALIQRMPREQARAHAAELLRRVAMNHRMDHVPGELSGGEQQRVALARALMLSPSLLLADEPTGNLDTKTGDGVLDLLFDLNREVGCTMLVVTHNREFAQRMPRVVHMTDGRLTDAA